MTPTSKITLNGKEIKNPRDAEILRSFLNKSESSTGFFVRCLLLHPTGNEEEAQDLLDRNKNGYVDSGDLSVALWAGISSRQFFRCFQIFKEHGYKLKTDPLFSEDEKSMLFQLAENDPEAALKNARKCQPYTDEVIEVAAKNAAEDDPGIALEYAYVYAGQPWAAEVIEIAAKNAAEDDPRAALEYACVYMNQPYAAEVIEMAARNAAENEGTIKSGGTIENEGSIENGGNIENEIESEGDDGEDESEEGEESETIDPSVALKYAHVYAGQPYAPYVIEIAVRNLAESNPRLALEFTHLYVDQPYAAEIFKQMAKKDPSLILKHTNDYVDQPYAADVIEIAARADPVAAVSSENEITEIYIMEQNKERVPLFKTLLDIIKGPYSDLEKKDLALLTHEIVSGELTIDQAYQISTSPDVFFDELVKIKSVPDHIGNEPIDIELKSITLRIVEILNWFHDSPEAERFSSLDGFNATKLYTLMVYAENEMFTSSFNGIFNRFMMALEREGITGDAFFEKMGQNRFRPFIKLCASYNRLNEFLNTMEEGKTSELLEKFASGIENATEMLSDAVSIADTFGVVTDKKILNVLHEVVEREFLRCEKEGKQDAKAIYGLLAGMFDQDRTDINEVSEKYSLPDLTTIPSHYLFNQGGTNIQQYFFYDDEDGVASFKSFTSQYKGKSNWAIKDHGTYISIISDRVNGRNIEIYANKPTADGVYNSPDKIEKMFEGRKVSPMVVVHRGHSFHADNTINKIPKTAKIVSLGSCGGYNNLAAILEKAPDAHIISTKATGTMRVNDPLLKMLNEDILEGKDIYWPDFWKRAEEKFGNIDGFSNYVSPHKNLGAKFLKAFFRQTKKNSAN